MVTMSVEATWQLSHINFMLPFSPTGMVVGNSEVLLKQSAKSREEEATTYGTMPGAIISRQMSAVMKDTVDVGGSTVDFEAVFSALVLFFDKWRLEDAEKPAAPPPVALGSALSEPLTPPSQ